MFRPFRAGSYNITVSRACLLRRSGYGCEDWMPRAEEQLRFQRAEHDQSKTGRWRIPLPRCFWRRGGAYWGRRG